MGHVQSSTRFNLPDQYPLFNGTQLPLSSTLKTLGLSFTKNLSWQFLIYTLSKSASKKLGVLSRLHPFFSPSQLFFYVQGPYFHAYCSSEFGNCMPPSFLQPHCTRLSTFSHPYSVHLSNARVNQYLHSFIAYSGKIWNTLLWLFPPDYDLNSFKREVLRHL